MIDSARRFFALFFVVVTAMTFVAGPTAAAPSDSAKYAAIVIDANTGEVLYARRADSSRYPASITKVMTLYLAYEALASGRLKLDERIVMSPRAAAQPPSKLGLAAGESLTVDDAIRALAIKSANDVAVALAERLGGTEARFAALMTLRAQELGMTHTRFVNASGLPDSRQISTARDIAILSRAIMRDYPQYYSYFGQRQWSFRGVNMNNHNGLLARMPGADGIKTGFTNASGYNLAASAVRGNDRLIAVVMGGSSGRSRDDHAADLLNVGFDVLRRRANGEIITVAQNLFENPTTPDSPISYASLDQGSRSNSPVVAGAAAGSGAGGMAPIANPSEPAPPARKRRDPNANWLVQVGAFKRQSEARSWLRQMERRFGDVLGEADGKVTPPAGGWYRVRYEGFTREAAYDACQALKAKRAPCLVIKP
jgi:D-alanyl-D-alanine carboxypeptidase (penicillin-binding protein 5/6)